MSTASTAVALFTGGGLSTGLPYEGVLREFIKRAGKIVSKKMKSADKQEELTLAANTARKNINAQLAIAKDKNKTDIEIRRLELSAAVRELEIRETSRQGEAFIFQTTSLRMEELKVEVQAIQCAAQVLLERIRSAEGIELARIKMRAEIEFSREAIQAKKEIELARIQAESVREMIQAKKEIKLAKIQANKEIELAKIKANKNVEIAKDAMNKGYNMSCKDKDEDRKLKKSVPKTASSPDAIAFDPGGKVSTNPNTIFHYRDNTTLSSAQLSAQRETCCTIS